MQTKTLLLVRHAKSSWDDPSQQDYDRPLNDRGKSDAPAMAKRLHKEKAIALDGIISSPAKRAFSTAKFFAEEFDIRKKNIIEAPGLYNATIDDFYAAVAGLDDSYKSVALFSHNPGITVFSNILTNTRIDDMPTCAIFALHVKADYWKDFKTAKKDFWFFDYPKNTI